MWGNNLKLARTLLATTILAEDFISIESSKVVVKDPVKFEAAFVQEKAAQSRRKIRDLNSQLAATTNSNQRKQIKSKVQAARRLQSVWWPKNRRLKLRGIRIKEKEGGEVIVNEPKAVQRGLIDEWKPLSAWKQVDEDKIAKLLGVYQRRNSDKFSFNSVILPKVGDVISVIKQSGNSMCGKRWCSICCIQSSTRDLRGIPY